jgi:polysaccharide biosynthesis protein PslG
MCAMRKPIVDRICMGVVPLLAVAVGTAGLDLTVHESVSARVESHAVVPTASIDTSASTVGIADSNLYYMDAADMTTAMDHLQSLGVTQVRLFLPWRDIETADDTYDWTHADQLIDAAAAHGIAVVAAVTSTPTWATNYGWVAANGEPTSTAAYADFMSQLAARYGAAANADEAKISAYEIWNEPNGFAGWFPMPDARIYTRLLQAAYTSIKAVDPTATVIGGALGTGLSMAWLTVNPVTFLSQMYAAGAEGYFDALSFHPYNLTGTLSDGLTFYNSAIKQLMKLREIMEANGDGEKLIWATEYGEPSTQGGDENQAAYIEDFLQTWSKVPGVGPSFIYSLIDLATGSLWSENNYGIFEDDWTPKLAAGVIKDWIATHTGPWDPDDLVEFVAQYRPASLATQMLTAVVNTVRAIIAKASLLLASAVRAVVDIAAGAVESAVGLAAAFAPAPKNPTTPTTPAAAAVVVPTVAVAEKTKEPEKTEGTQETEKATETEKVAEVEKATETGTTTVDATEAAPAVQPDTAADPEPEPKPDASGSTDSTPPAPRSHRRSATPKESADSPPAPKTRARHSYNPRRHTAAARTDTETGQVGAPSRHERPTAQHEAGDTRDAAA